MEPFLISAKLHTPIIAKNLTLDGLLGAIIFELSGRTDYHAAHKRIPLKCEHELFSASAIQFQGASQFIPRTYSASLRAVHDFQPNLVAARKNGSIPTIGESRRISFGNILNSYTSTFCERISFTATGDPEHTLALLAPIQFIGKRRSAGAGQISDWSLDTSPSDGLVDADGLPLRPIPEFLWQGRGDAIRAEAAWKPAYWDLSNRETCVVPGGML